MPIIDIKDVSKLYGFGDATTVALDEVSLQIEKGEFIAIMGASGSGKTTLMNVIGLLDRPSHGSYKLGGKDVARLRSNRRAKTRRDHIGFVFQSFNLLPRMSVIENVALPLAYRGKTQTRRLKTAGRILEQVGLADREYYRPHQLSGGQLQRAAIARALVNNPSIIIADEPTGNLDSNSTRVVMELLADVHKMGNTVLMVTHNPALTRYASRIIYMSDGAIVYDEATAIGEIPDRVRRALSFTGKMAAAHEEDLANVSALMGTMPHKKSPTRKTAKASGKTRKAKVRRKKS
jgi:putative ABC transport system ATP-binding protein